MDSKSTVARRISHILPKPTTFSTLPRLEDAVGSIPFDHGSHQLQVQDPGLTVPKFVIPGVTKLLIDGRPISTYTICNTSYNMEQPPNETRSEFRRTTVRGHTLRYTLEVIQQPEKARACGAGPRSSSDRRPVDPPPVVQLTVFDETEQQDITMYYDAGFMLYASLEVARPIANGRMHTGPAMPVLTGVAVASTAYLDRPRQAGYFIFPDLSVRHEGWYRLKFSLFESIKHPQDADPERPFGLSDPASQAVVAHESMANRMEVQSTPFQVFSAKKFPGLNTSTPLSRVVAEQGCRVRIRREIRQRKRNDDKQISESNDDGLGSYRSTPELPYANPGHSRTDSYGSPEGQYPQSLVRAAMDNQYGRPAPPSRKPSIASLTIPNMAMPLPGLSSYSARPQSDRSPSCGGQETKSYPSMQTYSPLISPIPKTSNLTLPPLNKTSTLGYNSASRLYNLPEPSASKRSYSPHTYDHNTAMKSGHRPDTKPVSLQSISSLASGNAIIEADTGDSDEHSSDDSLLEGEYTYPRADGTKGHKVALLINTRRL